MKEKKVKRFLAITMFVLLAFVFRGETFVVNSSVATVPLKMNTMFTQKKPINAINTNKFNTSKFNEARDSLTKMNKKDSLRNKLIDDVNIHISKNYRIHDSNLPMYLVDYSLKYNIDLCFMMAQTTIETGFGTTGAGRPSSRHSLFGVCKRYSNYNNAIEDYCKLLRRSYLGDSKTEHDLMKNYVTLGGARYAGDRGYERNLSAEYKRIRNRTQIYELWTELKNS